MSNGRFIVIEGLDGAGTTTQTELLCQRLRLGGREAVSTAEPTGGPIGSMIRQMLSRRIVEPSGNPINRESLALLFAADRLDHVASLIEPALLRGADVVSDRYFHSSFVYQGDVDDSDHFDIAWVRELNVRARIPDLTVFLDVPVDVSLQRLGERSSRDIYETRDKLTRLERRYEQVMSLLQREGQPIVRLDATRSVDDLADDIETLVEDL